LSVLFAAAEDSKETRTVFAGAMAGFVLLLVVSELGALGLRAIPTPLIAWLGVVPIALGLANAWSWVSGRHHVAHPSGVLATFPSAVSLILATGGDNISAYVPLFYGAGDWSLLICIAYAIAFALIALIARLAFGNARVHSVLHRIAQPLTSVVLVLVGCAMFAGLMHP
jgi:cadmium resistance protein CadD (predicted permease)